MLNKSSNNSVLDSFYEHISEGDWLEGVDIYQAGRIGAVKNFDGLITGELESTSERTAQVRMKIHPSGRQIQWIECTCRKNRALNRYCEHMAALMIHIDRENPKLLGTLDGKMPLKPPVGAVKAKATAAAETTNDKSQGAAQTILNHLGGSIHSISLLAKGPQIRVRLEIKEGQLTHYDLDLDTAAKFIKSNARSVKASPDVSTLKVFGGQAEMGTRIYQVENEEIVAEKVIAIKHTKKTYEELNKQQRNASLITSSKKFSQSLPSGEEGLYEFVGLKGAGKYLGSEFFFQPQRGYWPLKRETSMGWDDLPLKKSFIEDAAASFVEQNFAPYLTEGPVWLDETVKEPQIMGNPELTQIKIHQERDGWFTLDPRYGTGEGAVSMAELMLQFKKKKRSYFKSGDTWMKIPELVKQYDWDVDESGKLLKVNAIGLLRLKAAIGDFDHFAGSKTLLNQIRNKLEFKPEENAPSLEHTNLSLRNYQQTGLNWLWWLYNNNLHGLLADEMGLGKTHQAMALMSCVQSKVKEPKFLIICPTTVLDHWYDKLSQFCPNLSTLKHHGPKREVTLRNLNKKYITVLSSYGILLRDIKHLNKIDWDVIILDEAHFVKNNDTATYRAACQLMGKIRLCLTGTPMENHLYELKNIFDFLIPGFLGSDEYFRKQFVQPIINSTDIAQEFQLLKLLHPFKLRRTKDLVLSDLPEKVEDLRHCSLSEEQVKLYRDIVNLKARPIVQQIEDSSKPVPFLHVFAVLTLLKQVCDHPTLVLKDGQYKKHESGKFEMLLELLEEAFGSGHKVVIYTQYVGMANIIQQHLEEVGIGHVILTGQTRNRGKVIEKFQTDPNIKVFIGSLLAGGIGIDLTAASVVIHYDRWWNASKENQATDRVHRIGQNKNVLVYKMVTKGTLEEKIDKMIREKHTLFEKFMDRDEEAFKTLSRQDIIELLT